jgi:hypothetical protein
VITRGLTLPQPFEEASASDALADIPSIVDQLLRFQLRLPCNS